MTFYDYDKQYLNYSVDVLPCICGLTPNINHKRVCCGHGEFPLYAWVECPECGYSSKKYIVDGSYGSTNTVDDCIISWNNLMCKR